MKSYHPAKRTASFAFEVVTMLDYPIMSISYLFEIALRPVGMAFHYMRFEISTGVLFCQILTVFRSGSGKRVHRDRIVIVQENLSGSSQQTATKL